MQKPEGAANKPVLPAHEKIEQRNQERNNDQRNLARDSQRLRQIKAEQQQRHSGKDGNENRKGVKNVFDGDRRQAGHQRHSIANHRWFGWFGNQSAGESHHVSQRVAHQAAAQGVPKPEAFRPIKTKHPRKRANNVANGRNRDDQDKPETKFLDAVEDLAHACLAHEVSKQKHPGDRENDPKWRKLFLVRSSG